MRFFYLNYPDIKTKLTTAHTLITGNKLRSDVRLVVRRVESESGINYTPYLSNVPSFIFSSVAS